MCSNDQQGITMAACGLDCGACIIRRLPFERLVESRA
jgi:hypothetical protein